LRCKYHIPKRLSHLKENKRVTDEFAVIALQISDTKAIIASERKQKSYSPVSGIFAIAIQVLHNKGVSCINHTSDYPRFPMFSGSEVHYHYCAPNGVNDRQMAVSGRR
jgi:hypothetical protein